MRIQQPESQGREWKIKSHPHLLDLKWKMWSDKKIRAPKCRVELGLFSLSE